MKTSSKVYKQLLNEDSYFIEWGTIDRQCCCDCSLVHDVTYKLRRGGVEIFIRRNERSTSNRRRAKLMSNLSLHITQQGRLEDSSQIAARMRELASEPCEKGFVPISPETLNEWARQLLPC